MRNQCVINLNQIYIAHTSLIIAANILFQLVSGGQPQGTRSPNYAIFLRDTYAKECSGVYYMVLGRLDKADKGESK